MTTELAIRKKQLRLDRDKLMDERVEKLGRFLLEVAKNPVVISVGGLVLMQYLSTKKYWVADEWDNRGIPTHYKQVDVVDPVANAAMQASFAGIGVSLTVGNIINLMKGLV